MRGFLLFVPFAAAACSDTGEAPSGGAPESEVAAIAPAGGDTFVTFVDEATGFMTDEVHDADREVISFDSTREALVFRATGDAVSGWSVSDGDLDWARFGVPFRVRFGTEDGLRRAYFTERGPGTICDLSLRGPDDLSISATRERPPNP